MENQATSKQPVKRLTAKAKTYGRELAEEAAARDILHPGAEELPTPSRGELFSQPSRWQAPDVASDSLGGEGPLVSVIVPIYNKQNVLRRCLKTVLGQTYANLQIILVNDGSTDESLAVASWLTRNDPRVSIVDKPNGGVSAARNTALGYAAGEWVYFCDADDWVEPTCVQSLLHSALENECDLVISDFYRVRGDRYYAFRQTAAGVYSQAAFVDHMTKRPANFYYGALWNKLFRRSLIESAGLRFNEAVRYGEDHLFILEYLSHCKKVVAIEEPLYYYVDTPGSLIHQGLNPAGVAKNKAYTIERYAKLCDECGLVETTSDILHVASFLITPATDGIVGPFDKLLREDQIPC